MKTFELFAGCGGLAKGLELAGFKHSGFLEINHQACESLRANFRANIVHEDDARTFDFGKYAGTDMVSGGPPCQPFSLGGLAQANDDTRDMFPQACRAISEIHPRAFVFENVKGLLRAAFKPYFEYIVLRLRFPDCRIKKNEDWQTHSARLQRIANGARYSGLRYRVDYRLMNAVKFGVPQFRERVFIVGLREDVHKEWEWPAETTPNAESYVTIADALADVPDPRGRHKIPDHDFRGGAHPYPGHTGSDFNHPSKTIKAGVHGVPGGENMVVMPNGELRYFSVYEAKLIQSFPKDFKVTGSWTEALRQIGNAVPVRLAEIVGRQIFRLLRADGKANRN